MDVHAYPDRIVLRWDIPLSNVDGSRLDDLSGFKVYRTAEKIGEECEDCEKAGKLHANIDVQHPTNATIAGGEVAYSDKDVTTGYSYHYAVAAYNLKGREGPKSQKVTVYFGDFPPAPTGLRAEYDPSGVVLKWDAPPRPAGIRNYRIYRASVDDLREMRPLGRTRWAETSYVDKDVEKESTYYYVVRSLKMNRGISLESGPSTVAEVTIPRVRFGPPENVNTASTTDGIRIYWSPVKIENEKVEYNIYRSEAGKVFEKMNREPLRNPWFVDKDVKKNTRYRYAVTAFPQGRPEEESSRAASEDVRFAP